MTRLFVILTFLFFFDAANASRQQCLKPVDSSGYLFEFDLKYVGSNFHIDMNYRYVLDYLRELAVEDSTLNIHIRGHVCCGPSYRLSKKRAKQVYKYLKRIGVPKEQLSYKGYSDTAPLAFPEKTEEDQARNRRVDFILYRID